MTSQDAKTVLDPIIDQYLKKWRSLGRKFSGEESVLRSLNRWLQEQKASDLTAPLFDAWCRTHESLSGTVRRNRQRIVRNFCLYRRRMEPTCFVPDPNRFPKPSPHAAPVILQEEDIAKLLNIVDRFVKTVFKPFLRTLFSEKNGLFLDLTVVSVPERFWFFSF